MKKEKGKGWNHRVLVFKDGEGFFFDIYDVYYDENGKPNGYGHPESVHGNSVAQMEACIQKMQAALSQPFLWAEKDRMWEVFDPLKEMTPEMKIEAIKAWQASELIHPLTCRDSASHEALIASQDGAGNIYLHCPTCNLVTFEVPESVYTAWFYNEHAKHKAAMDELRAKLNLPKKEEPKTDNAE